MKRKILMVSLLFFSLSALGADDKPALDKDSGLVMGDNWQLVKANCTACHSAAIVTQNRMSRETWLDTIRWMQKTQGLWPLSTNEKPILDYLEKYYSPSDTGRRKNLPTHLMPARIKIEK